MAKSALSARILPETLRSIAFGAIGVAYAPLGTPLAHPSRLVILKNVTDIPVIVSWSADQSDSIYLPANSHETLDIGTNRGTYASEFAIAQFTQFWVKQSGAVAATLGGVYLESLYAEEHLI